MESIEVKVFKSNPGGFDKLKPGSLLVIHDLVAIEKNIFSLALFKKNDFDIPFEMILVILPHVMFVSTDLQVSLLASRFKKLYLFFLFKYILLRIIRVFADFGELSCVQNEINGNDCQKGA